MSPSIRMGTVVIVTDPHGKVVPAIVTRVVSGVAERAVVDLELFGAVSGKLLYTVPYNSNERVRVTWRYRDDS